jgi:hypothetical protein
VALALTQPQSDELMLMARPIPRADLKKQESRWACRRSGSSHFSVGLTGLLNRT